MFCGCQLVQFAPVHLYTGLALDVGGGVYRCTGCFVGVSWSSLHLYTCTPVHLSCIGCWRGGVQVYRLFCGCQLVQFAPVHLYTCTLVLHWMLEGGVQVYRLFCGCQLVQFAPVHLYTCTPVLTLLCHTMTNMKRHIMVFSTTYLKTTKSPPQGVCQNARHKEKEIAQTGNDDLPL